MKTLGALFQLAAAGGVAWLWAHGYFNNGLTFAQGLLQKAPPLTPFKRPVAGATGFTLPTIVPVTVHPGRGGQP